MKSFRKFLDEDGVAANAVGGGQIAGVGIGPNGEPDIDKKKRPILATLKRKVPNVTTSKSP